MSRMRSLRPAARLVGVLTALVLAGGALVAPVDAADPAACADNGGTEPAPRQGSYFSHPYGKGEDKNRLRYLVIRAVDSVPACESISISVYSFADNLLADSLIRAYRRGVRVRVMANSHITHGKDYSPSFRRVQKAIGGDRSRPSWASACRGSCRGTGGNHHSKMYLFSRVRNDRAVTMMGSHNSTLKAANGQWNSLDVYDDQATYDYYSSIFEQETLDRPQAFQDRVTGQVETMFFPRPGTTARNDPFMSHLGGIQCKGAAPGYGRNGRTKVRVGMYAWHDSRGVYLAKRIRSLWSSGCDVAVEYAIMGNEVKRILYSPAGRGRIPMRQVTTSTRSGTIVNYLHEKYVTVLGRQNGDPRAQFTMTGTSNWANLGLASDESVQVWHDAARGHAYRADFYRVWRGPKAHVPSPTSRLPGKVGGKKVQFGKGKYRNLEDT